MFLFYNLIVIAVMSLMVLAIASATSRPPLRGTAVRPHGPDQAAPMEPAQNLVRAAGWQ